MHFVAKLTFLFLLALAMGQEYRARGVFSKEKLLGIDRPVRGFGIPEGYQKKFPTPTNALDGLPKVSIWGTVNQNNEQVIDTNKGENVEYKSNIYQRTASSKLTDNLENDDKNSAQKLSPTINNQEEEQQGQNMFRALIVVAALVVVVIVFLFVKFAKIASIFGRNASTHKYAHKKCKHSKFLSEDEPKDYEEESVRLLYSDKRSCHTCTD